MDALSRFVDPESGNLERYFHAEWSGVLDVQVDGAVLRWRRHPRTVLEGRQVLSLEQLPVIRAGPGLLEQFLALVDDASGAAIAAYAARWGVLDACEHERPPGHTEEGVNSLLGCLPRGAVDGTSTGWVSLHTWRSLAFTARAILRIAAAVEDGRPGAAADWVSAEPTSLARWWGIPSPWINGVPLWGHDAGADGLWLGTSLAVWLNGPRVTPTFVWYGNRREWVLTPGNREWHGLYGALGVALMLAVARADEFRFCADCQALYARPSGGGYKYCSACGTNEAAWRRSKRRQRAATKPGRDDSG